MNETQERILKFLFVLIWALALIHMLAEQYYLYWTVRWFDMVTHFLGGAWIGLASIWVWYFSGYVRKPQFPKGRVLLLAVLSGLVVGVIWEVYEFAVWKVVGRPFPENYIGDTQLDIIMDMCGAYVGYVTYRFLSSHRFTRTAIETTGA